MKVQVTWVNDKIPPKTFTCNRLEVKDGILHLNNRNEYASTQDHVASIPTVNILFWVKEQR